MKVGIGVADLTPSPGITLSGFIARQNQPSERFADPLAVRCLAFEDRGHVHWLFAYDLLGIGAELWAQSQARLKAELGDSFASERAVFASTHTHSAPATVHLENCGVVDRSYWERVTRATAEAARAALERATEASLRVAQRGTGGLTYNRRRILEDGKVSMALDPKQKVVAVGPVDDLLSVLGWYDLNGQCVAAAVHFACHPVINGSQTGTAEFPGRLCQHVEQLLGAPCLFLQGAAGDINPVCIVEGYDAIARFGEQVAAQMRGIADEMKPVETTALRSAATMLPLQYDRALDYPALRREMERLEAVAAWKPDSPTAGEALQVLANIMNCKPDEITDPTPHVFSARTLAGCGRRILDAVGKPLPPCPLFLGVWDLGGLGFLFAGAEVFARTGLELKKLAPGNTVLPVGYCAPLIGYLPTREARKEGGYEADYAWRYYGHLAPFAADSEERAREQFQKLLGELT